MKRPEIFLYLLITGFSLLPVSVHAEIGSQTLTYQVDYRGTDAGELEITIDKNSERYEISTVSHLSMVAQLFLKSYTIDTNYKIENGNVLLETGSETLNQSGETIRKFEIDRKARKVNYKDGNSIPFDASTRVDADAFPLGMMTTEPNKLIGKPYLSVSPKRSRLFAVDSVEEETITVAAGSFDSHLITSSRPDAPERFIKIWLQKGDNPVPLKIVSGKPGKVTTMTLQSLKN